MVQPLPHGLGINDEMRSVACLAVYCCNYGYQQVKRYVYTVCVYVLICRYIIYMYTYMEGGTLWGPHFCSVFVCFQRFYMNLWGWRSGAILTTSHHSLQKAFLDLFSAQWWGEPSSLRSKDRVGGFRTWGFLSLLCKERLERTFLCFS